MFGKFQWEYLLNENSNSRFFNVHFESGGGVYIGFTVKRGVQCIIYRYTDTIN